MKGQWQPIEWDPLVKLDHFTDAQQKVVRKLLREDCQFFAYDDDDIGCILSLKMHIPLHDMESVQKTYLSVPKPLHAEIKEYLQDLLNKGSVVPSRSS